MKSYLIKSVGSILLFIAIAYIGSFDLKLKLAISTFVYTISSYYVIYRSQNQRELKLNLLILVLPILIVYVPIHLLMYKDSAISLPGNIFSLLGILFGIILFYVNRLLKIIFSIVFVLVTTWTAYTGYEIWLHKINFGTFQPQTNEVFKDALFYSPAGKTLSKKDFSNKIVVLDFWNTSCAECFRRFPILQKTYNHYKNTKGVAIYAVNIPLKRDRVNQALHALIKRNYSFPLLLASDDSVATAFGVLSFPTVIVLDNNSNIVYRGSIEDVSQTIETLRSR